MVMSRPHAPDGIADTITGSFPRRNMQHGPASRLPWRSGLLVATPGTGKTRVRADDRRRDARPTRHHRSHGRDADRAPAASVGAGGAPARDRAGSGVHELAG